MWSDSMPTPTKTTENMFTRCTWMGYHVPEYREGLSRPLDEWLFFWADTMLTHYYGEAKL